MATSKKKSPKNEVKTQAAPKTTQVIQEPIIVPEAPKDLLEPTMKVARSNPADPKGRLEDVLALTDGHELSPILQTAKDIVRVCKQKGMEPPDWCVITLVGTFDVVTSREWNALRDNVA